MVATRNDYFVGRQKELRSFQKLLDCEARLRIVNVCGHSGVGKTWVLEEFRHVCGQAHVPFSFLNPREVTDDPASLLHAFARRFDWKATWRDDHQTFEQLLGPFLARLHAMAPPAIVLMLDNYDQLYQFDPYVRHLIRCLSREAPSPPNGNVNVGVGDDAARQRFIVVISSIQPLEERWPLNPIYRRPLRTMYLPDFSLEETLAYLRQPKFEVPSVYHHPIYRLTRGYPLALSLVTLLKTWPEQNIERGEEEALLPQKDRTTLVQEILTRGLRGLQDDPQRAQIVALLRAGAAVRRFDRPLLMAMLKQPDLPTALLDRIPMLSMVTRRAQSGRPAMFSLHPALRDALLLDARQRGLDATLQRYRQRALSYYTAQYHRQEGIGPAWGLDVLFLHDHPMVRSLFFNTAFVPLVTETGTFAELEVQIAPLMRKNPLYHEIDFQGETLERFIAQTQQWLAFDYQQHGESLRYFHVVRRGPGGHPDHEHHKIAGFVLTVPATQEAHALLRQDLMGEIYEQAVGSVPVDARYLFALRLVCGALDSLSALVRTVFMQAMSLKWGRLILIMPWKDIVELAKGLQFDILAANIEHPTGTYTIAELNVSEQGGVGAWLLSLTRQVVGLPLTEDWTAYKAALQAAIDNLHTSFNDLSRNILIDEFDLTSEMAPNWQRAEVLIQAIQAAVAAMRLPPEEDYDDAPFHILNESYGIHTAAWQRAEYGQPPTVQELCEHFNCSRTALYNRRSDALEMLARAFRRTTNNEGWRGSQRGR